MRIRYIPADPAGNLTALTLTQVRPEERAAVAAQMMARCLEGFEQVGFIGAHAAKAVLPRLDMMGGEFCGNAARAFACWVDRQRGGRESSLNISISGACQPGLPSELDAAHGKAYAQMPIPIGLEEIRVMGRTVPVVHMEGIDHALMPDCAPSQELAQAVWEAMPAQGCAGRPVYTEHDHDAAGVRCRDGHAGMGKQLRFRNGCAGVVSRPKAGGRGTWLCV